MIGTPSPRVLPKDKRKGQIGLGSVLKGVKVARTVREAMDR